MPYGQEAKEELTKIVQGKCLRVLVFDEDRYGRCVGDVYCNGIFVQVCCHALVPEMASKFNKFCPPNILFCAGVYA